jgi:hypothetical protein
MDDMTLVTLVMAGIAFVVAVSWQLAGRKPFDAIEFAARLVASFIGAAVMAVLLYGMVFVIGMANIAGSGRHMDAYLKASFWISIVIAFAIAMTRGEDRKTSPLRFIASWIMAWVCVVGAGILLLLGFCAVMFSV